MSKAVKFQAISATLWSVARIGFDQFFSFIVFVVIARLLEPAEVGLFALAMIVAELARIFSTSGFTDAVTRADTDLEEEVSRAAFWANMALGFTCAVTMSLLAQPIAIVMNTPRLAEILIALAWTIPLSAGGAIHMARQLRRFGHKTLAIRSLVSGLIGGSVAIAAAYAGYGVWSLVIQRFITEAVTMLTAWLAFRWWPSTRFRWSTLSDIFSFSMHISASKLLGVLISRIQDVVIGAFAGPAAVGIYRIARRTIDMLMTLTLTPLSSVSVNFFVAVREDPDRFSAAFLRLLSVASVTTFPAFFGVAAIAGDLVPFIYGPKWAPSVFALQLLAPLSLPLVISLFTMPVLTVFGEAKLVTRMTLIQLFLSLALAIAAAPFGMEAVIGALLVRTYIMIPYQIRLIQRYTQAGPKQVLVTIAPPLAASVIMAALCWLLLEQVMPTTWAAWQRLFAVVPSGAVIFVGLLYVMDKRSILWSLEILKGMAARRKDKGRSVP